jgi:hypothetical protein
MKAALTMTELREAQFRNNEPMTEQPPILTRRRRNRDLRVKRLRKQMIADAPHLDDIRLAPLVNAYAKVAILASDSYKFIKERGIAGADGELRPAVEVVNRLFASQFKMAATLNLTPDGLRKMRDEKPADLIELIARHNAEEVVDDGK